MSALRKLRAAAFRTYWALAKLITPDLVYSQYRYHQALRAIVPAGCRWIDLGCGHQMFAEWMGREEQELAERASVLVGVDLDFDSLRKNRFAHLRIKANLEQLPIPACSFDLVTANMVMEHVEHPKTVLQEAHRVLGPGGLLVFHTPNRFNPAVRVAGITPKALKNRIVWLLEGRKEEDIFPTFYRVNSIQEIQTLAAESGFEVRKIATIRSSAITGTFGPFSVPELLFLRMLRSPRWEHLRNCIICILQKPVDGTNQRQAIEFEGLKTVQIQA
jgi:ubiquinone/menaquinone biosynthesis C-methylase UbiE